MFKKFRKTKPKLKRSEGPRGNPWDRETIDWLANISDIPFYITHIERMYKSDSFKGSYTEENPEVIITGFLPYAPQYIYVVITFDAELKDFGVASLTYYYDNKHQSGNVNLPALKIQLRDQDNSLKTGFVEALRDSLMANKTSAAAKLSASFHENLDNRDESWFTIKGVIIWDLLHSPRLSKWAYPSDHEDYDLNTYPRPSELRAAPVIFPSKKK